MRSFPNPFKSDEFMTRFQLVLCLIAAAAISTAIFLMSGCVKEKQNDFKQQVAYKDVYCLPMCSGIPIVIVDGMAKVKGKFFCPTQCPPGIISISAGNGFVKIDFIKLHNPSTGDVLTNGSAYIYPSDVTRPISINKLYCPPHCLYDQNYSNISFDDGFTVINGIQYNVLNWDATE